MISAWSKYMRGVKYCTIILTAALVGAYFSMLHHSQKKPEIVIQFEDDFQYFPDLMPRFTRDMLAKDFESCLFNNIVVGIGDKNSEAKNIYFMSFMYPKELSAKIFEGTFQMGKRLRILADFADLMSSLKIKAVLIEPSLIFCMLSPLYKKLLLKRKFQPEIYFKSSDIVTFGIREKYARRLEKSETQNRIADANFTIEVVQDPSPSWMQSSKNVTNHLFFLRESVVVHVVVFHKRGSYLWHGGIKSGTGGNHPPKESLHFADSDSAYDSFIPVDPGFHHPFLSSLLIPSDPQHLLFQMPASRFLECSEEVQRRFHTAEAAPEVKPRAPPSQLDQHRFKTKTVAAISALKNRLTPLLMRFFMSSGTLLGWYRQCGIIPYTSDVDFFAWAEEVDDLKELLQLFEDDGHLRLKEKMGIVEQGLEFNLNYNGLRVDLFFMYPESNGTWYAGHRPSRKYFFKYHYPNFTLCSADLLGRRVLVPCETEKILEAEYGPKWLTPVTSWNYERSIFNRGPNIYWNESMLEKVYVEV